MAAIAVVLIDEHTLVCRVHWEGGMQVVAQYPVSRGTGHIAHVAGYLDYLHALAAGQRHSFDSHLKLHREVEVGGKSCVAQGIVQREIASLVIA